MSTQTADVRKGALLALLAASQFVVVLDASITNVALPSIGRALDISQDGLSWVVNAYTLTFGGFLLLGGRLADLLGRRRVYMAGLILFGIASFLGGLSQSDPMLIASRALQGLGAALLSPAALSILTATFTEGSERNRALGVWGAVAGAGGAAGVLLGGILTEYLSWRWVLLVNVPIVATAAFLAPRIISESRVTHRAAFDVAGAFSVTAGVSLLVYALVDANNKGWGSTADDRPDRPRHAAAARVRRHRAPFRGAARPGRHLRLAHADRVLRHRRADRRIAVLDVLLHLALHAAGARLVGDPRRPVLPAARDHDRDLRRRRLAGHRPLRLQAGARDRPRFISVAMVWWAQIGVDGTFLSDVLGPSLVAAVGLGLSFVRVTVGGTSGIRERRRASRAD